MLLRSARKVTQEKYRSQSGASQQPSHKASTAAPALMSIDCFGHGVCHSTESTLNNNAAAVLRVVSKGRTGKGQSTATEGCGWLSLEPCPPNNYLSTLALRDKLI